jgi:hypothetical protein
MLLRAITAFRSLSETQRIRRTRLIAPLRAGSAMAGLTPPLLPAPLILDLNGATEGRWSALGVVAGTALLGMALLWFRRSRRAAADASANTEPSAPERQDAAPPAPPRAPARIRGLLLLNLQPTDGTAQIETAPPLGRREAVVRAVQAAVPGLTVDAAGRGELAASDHRLALDLGPHDPVHAVVASAEGDTAIDLLRTLVQKQGWRAYAARAGVFIEPDALELFALPDALPSRERP